MKIEEQVCSLELAKRLKELGVKQESKFYWREVIDNYDVPPEILGWQPEEKQGTYADNEGDWKEVVYSAFTVAELEKLLPDTIALHNQLWHYRSGKGACWYEGGELSPNQYEILRITESADTQVYIPESHSPDCKAKMLTYLLENNLLK